MVFQDKIRRFYRIEIVFILDFRSPSVKITRSSKKGDFHDRHIHARTVQPPRPGSAHTASVFAFAPPLLCPLRAFAAASPKFPPNPTRIAHYQTNPTTPIPTQKTPLSPRHPRPIHQTNPQPNPARCIKLHQDATSTQNANFHPPVLSERSESKRPILTPEIGCPPRHVNGTLIPLDPSPLKIPTALQTRRA
jgi:hypothetical protein